MRLHIRQVPFDFITEEDTKSSHRVAAAMVFLLVIVVSLLFATVFSAFAAADEDAGQNGTQTQSGSPAAPARSGASSVLPVALGGVASVLLIGAARRRAAHLDI